MRKINEKLKDISSYLSIFALFLLTLITLEISCKNWKNQMFKSYYKENISTMWELFGKVLSELPEAVLLLRTAHHDKGNNGLKLNFWQMKLLELSSN